MLFTKKRACIGKSSAHGLGYYQRLMAVLKREGTAFSKHACVGCLLIGVLGKEMFENEMDDNQSPFFSLSVLFVKKQFLPRFLINSLYYSWPGCIR